MKCGRCGEKIDKCHPLDAVAHPYTDAVGDCCLKDDDEVADV